MTGVFWTWTEREHGAVEEEAGEGDELQPRDCLRQPLVVLRQPPEARRPREGALHHPPARQQDKAFPDPGMSDHLQPDAPRLGLSGGPPV